MNNADVELADELIKMDEEKEFAEKLAKQLESEAGK